MQIEPAAAGEKLIDLSVCALELAVEATETCLLVFVMYCCHVRVVH